MRKLYVFLLSIFVIIFLSIIVFTSKNNGLQYIETTTKEDSIKNLINNMNLDEKIGQLIISGFYGYKVDKSLENLIKNNNLGGVILFERNIKDSKQLLELTNSLKEINKTNISPLFISTDEEGSIVTRMPKEIKSLPSNYDIGKINNENFSYNIGKILGKELGSFGFNMDYAPVLDINSNPNNPVIGNRSFGNNKEIVSRLGVKTMKGIQSSNVISVIKHFPGHGDTSVDSHLALPIINHDLNRLNNLELVPFKYAIKNGADAIMVSHILLNKLDKNNPATLSKNIITNLLREKLNFNGVVITDDMTMGAIVNNYNIGDAAVKAINAGSDIILVCHKYENVNIVINAIKNAVKNDIISEKRIDESLYRILSLKRKYKLNNNKIDSVDIKGINKSIDNLLNSYKY